MPYDQQYDGEWVWPIKRGYKMMCCSCGLVHRMDFRTKTSGRGTSIALRVFRDDRATAAARRGKQFKKNKIVEA